MMARTNADVLSGVVGMFMLLPSILSSWLLPDPARPAKKTTVADMIAANADYLAANWPVVLANAIVVGFGSLAVLTLLLNRDRPTVSASLRIALLALPLYLLANILQSLVAAAGLVAFIVPGLYLLARFICVAPVAAVEKQRNPIKILARSFAVTRGNGWRILFMMAVVLLVMTVISTALNTLFGLISTVLLPPDLARLLQTVVQSLCETALAIIVLLVSASIYRQAVAE